MLQRLGIGLYRVPLTHHEIATLIDLGYLHAESDRLRSVKPSPASPQQTLLRQQPVIP
jgi:hypothetical protein